MFDFNWSEIALVAVVALVLIGPKDMPVAIRALAAGIRKLRRMAGEFQHHVDDMVREADLSEVRDSINEIRGMNLRGMMRDAVDPDRSIARAFDDPFRDHPLNPTVPPAAPAAAPGPAAGEAPAFIPPGARPPPPEGQAAPAFVPPRAAG
jgi:sec-independent protein translocase protein TatB